jgi:hypothetical protein
MVLVRLSRASSRQAEHRLNPGRSRLRVRLRPSTTSISSELATPPRVDGRRCTRGSSSGAGSAARRLGLAPFHQSGRLDVNELAAGFKLRAGAGRVLTDESVKPRAYPRLGRGRPRDEGRRFGDRRRPTDLELAHCPDPVQRRERPLARPGLPVDRSRRFRHDGLIVTPVGRSFAPPVVSAPYPNVWLLQCRVPGFVFDGCRRALSKTEGFCGVHR